jgi:alkylation response protein AidB-like acyl-CoA dehydrogenase
MNHAINWPADELGEWGTAADDFAQGRLTAAAQGHEHHADPAFGAFLDDMREMGFLALCADERFEGLAQGPGALARVLEPVCAVDASAGAAIYASAAAHLALLACALPDDTVQRVSSVSGSWLAWPAFHAVDEQAWPDLDARGQLHGWAEMLLLGTHARWAVLPARAGNALRLVLVDLDQATVTRGLPVRTLGLSACGVADVSFKAAACKVVSADAAAVMQQIESPLAAAVIAMQCGVMRGSLQVSQTYADERNQGGGNLLGWGEVRRLLSVGHERLHAACGLLGQALHETADASGATRFSAAYGALHVGQMACEHTTDGVQLLGGNGFMKQYGQEKRMRDARQLAGLLGGVAWRRQRLVGRVLAA